MPSLPLSPLHSPSLPVVLRPLSLTLPDSSLKGRNRTPDSVTIIQNNKPCLLLNYSHSFLSSPLVTTPHVSIHPCILCMKALIAIVSSQSNVWNFMMNTDVCGRFFNFDFNPQYIFLNLLPTYENKDLQTRHFWRKSSTCSSSWENFGGYCESPVLEVICNKSIIWYYLCSPWLFFKLLCQVSDGHPANWKLVLTNISISSQGVAVIGRCLLLLCSKFCFMIENCWCVNPVLMHDGFSLLILPVSVLLLFCQLQLLRQFTMRNVFVFTRVCVCFHLGLIARETCLQASKGHYSVI